MADAKTKDEFLDMLYEQHQKQANVSTAQQTLNAAIAKADADHTAAITAAKAAYEAEIAADAVALNELAIDLGKP
jgi:regulator of protease activity HflC (stomatin/prohibitin superfamily)